MTKIPYLVKRGNMFWWRRRKPVFILLQPSCGTEKACARTDRGRFRTPGHFAISLRTPCLKEAGRHAARLNHLFEEKRRSIEIARSGDVGMSDQSYLERAMADMAATLRAQAEMMARQMEAGNPTVSVATSQAPMMVPAQTTTPPRVQPEANSTQSSNRIDDPEFERAILEMADREGWWHENPDEIVAQFGMMLTGLFTLQEEYLRYCVRKGLDPANALPSLAGLGNTLASVTDDIEKNSAPEAPSKAQGQAEIARTHRPGPVKRKDGRRFSEHARRFLELRSQGFDLKRRHETPDTKAGERFTKTSRANFEGTIRLFLEAHGDIFVENIDEALLVEFFSLLDRIPATHGKSSKDRRPIREVIKEADRDERNTIKRREAEMQRDGLSPGETEEILDTLHVRRLRTNTCKRHMDTIDQIMAFANFNENGGAKVGHGSGGMILLRAA